MTSYRDCKHYEEIVMVLAENKDLEDISFEINEIQNCKHCNATEGGVCSLWIGLAFVQNMRPQMSIPEARLTIDNLDQELGKIAMELLQDFSENRDIKGHRSPDN